MKFNHAFQPVTPRSYPINSPSASLRQNTITAQHNTDKTLVLIQHLKASDKIMSF